MAFRAVLPPVAKRPCTRLGGWVRDEVAVELATDATPWTRRIFAPAKAISEFFLARASTMDDDLARASTMDDDRRAMR